MYSYPIGAGDRRKVIDELIEICREEERPLIMKMCIRDRVVVCEYMGVSENYKIRIREIERQVSFVMDKIK